MREKENAAPTIQAGGGLRVRTIELILSVTVSYVIPGRRIGGSGVIPFPLYPGSGSPAGLGRWCGGAYSIQPGASTLEARTAFSPRGCLCPYDSQRPSRASDRPARPPEPPRPRRPIDPLLPR